MNAHSIGANSVSWAPAILPGSLINAASGAAGVGAVKRFASAGCDNLVKIWRFVASFFFFFFFFFVS